MRTTAFIIFSAFLLTSCDFSSLSASLTGSPDGPLEYSETAMYTSLGKEHSYSVHLTINEENLTVEDLAIQPLATDFAERSIQRVFAANIREEVLGNTVGDIEISKGPTNEKSIREAFRSILKKAEQEIQQ